MLEYQTRGKPGVGAGLSARGLKERSVIVGCSAKKRADQV